MRTENVENLVSKKLEELVSFRILLTSKGAKLEVTSNRPPLRWRTQWELPYVVEGKHWCQNFLVKYKLPKGSNIKLDPRHLAVVTDVDSADVDTSKLFANTVITGVDWYLYEVRKNAYDKEPKTPLTLEPGDYLVRKGKCTSNTWIGLTYCGQMIGKDGCTGDAWMAWRVPKDYGTHHSVSRGVNLICFGDYPKEKFGVYGGWRPHNAKNHHRECQAVMRTLLLLAKAETPSLSKQIPTKDCQTSEQQSISPQQPISPIVRSRNILLKNLRLMMEEPTEKLNEEKKGILETMMIATASILALKLEKSGKCRVNVFDALTTDRRELPPLLLVLTSLFAIRFGITPKLSAVQDDDGPTLFRSDKSKPPESVRGGNCEAARGARYGDFYDADKNNSACIILELIENSEKVANTVFSTLFYLKNLYLSTKVRDWWVSPLLGDPGESGRRGSGRGASGPRRRLVL